MFKWAITLVATLLLAGCADPIDNAKKALDLQLKHADTIVYRNVTRFPGDIVCGEVSAMDRMGEGGKYQPFLYRDKEALIGAPKIDRAIFCSEDPAAELQTRMGIGPVNRDNSKLMTVYRQLTELDDALQGYLAAKKEYPDTRSGLLVLVPGYIDKISSDPWGNPYLYQKERRLHGVSKVYKLQTLGKNRMVGGEGEDADIGNWHLKYLHHILNL